MKFKAANKIYSQIQQQSANLPVVLQTTRQLARQSGEFETRFLRTLQKNGLLPGYALVKLNNSEDPVYLIADAYHLYC